MSEAAALKVFLIAGEPSGDRLGAALMRALRAEASREIVFSGLGGAAMAAEGLESLFPIEEIAVMGVAEVLPRLRTILRRIRETADAAIAAAPDIIISIDAPDFGLRVVDKARPRLGDRTLFVHYVAPSVWAWRAGRAAKLAKRVDHLLALLPFEPPYFEKEGLSCDFVGHPIVERSLGAEARASAGAALRQELGVAPEAPVLAVLPGSRAGEVNRLVDVFRETVGELLAQRPDLGARGLTVFAPLAEHVAAALSERFEGWAAPVKLIDPRGRSFAEAERRKQAAMAAADIALAASGTVSLELAAARTPMVIGYRMHPLTAAIGRRLLQVDSATLVNLVSDTRAVPEYLQEFCRPRTMAGALARLTPPPGEPTLARDFQLAAADLTMQRLGEGGPPPSIRAARSVLSALERRRGARK